jgi:hypothetical protein
MNREQILQVLARLNDAIASLNVRLHPPPAAAGEQQELESELAAAEQSRETLEQALNNLPAPTPEPSFATARASTALAAHATAQSQTAIEMSKAVRKQVDHLATLVERVRGAQGTGGIETPATRRAGGELP